MLRHQLVQSGDPSQPLRQPPPGQHPPRLVFDLNVMVGLGPIVPNKQHRGPLAPVFDQHASNRGEDLLRPNGSVLNRHDIPPALPAPSPTAGARSSHRPQIRPGKMKCSPAAGSDNSIPEGPAIALPLGTKYIERALQRALLIVNTCCYMGVKGGLAYPTLAFVG